MRALSSSPATSDSNTVHVDLDLVRRYNQPGPRYTSYPTAPHFSEEVTDDAFAQALSEGNAETPLSLYVHLPFCRSLCYYCGCHMKVTHRPEVIERYLGYAKREMEIAAQYIDLDRRVVQVHWGGGTPSYLTPEQIGDLMTHTRSVFSFDPDAEISLEADPRGLTEEHLAAAADAGFNRISYGVQDVDPKVQEAINRVQPTELVENAVRWARMHGFRSINLDLVYGLPHQTSETFSDTVDTVMRLDPERIALFSYAHIPSLRKHQTLIPEADLPEPEEKLRIFKMATERLTGEGGYRFIGMDHFARPDDELAVALDTGNLHRNFQGYSTRAGADVVAFGMSGISQLDGAYTQNIKGLPDYYARIDEGRLATYRGYEVTRDDRVRRAVIMELMCNSLVLKADIESRFDIDFDATFTSAMEALEPMVDDGLVTVTEDAVRVEPEGRLFIRNAAMAFDAYLNASQKRPLYSKTV
ncbi:oxygen-independent coproporphyrinogen III oxidase [Longibacter salinarum]|uniref:Coproporphyrinogen-III oxidase n=1 Tax=Longibacter salinarum TaxID=1850348 RepID=A0A2A8D128_9BACT|nr:oxygen-independent coproporphyrinogen III oxidase [Longibacter salinarum]PEN14348.1 oxygen-independent coproporphyrinogen III oxidase [Longibacter salinarum]